MNNKTQAASNQFKTYQCRTAEVAKFNSLNQGAAAYITENKGDQMSHAPEDDRMPRKIADPTNIEDMHCHIVMQIQKLRRIAMDLEQKIAM